MIALKESNGLENPQWFILGTKQGRKWIIWKLWKHLSKRNRRNAKNLVEIPAIYSKELVTSSTPSVLFKSICKWKHHSSLLQRHDKEKSTLKIKGEWVSENTLGSYSRYGGWKRCEVECEQAAHSRRLWSAEFSLTRPRTLFHHVTFLTFAPRSVIRLLINNLKAILLSSSQSNVKCLFVWAHKTLSPWQTLLHNLNHIYSQIVFFLWWEMMMALHWFCLPSECYLFNYRGKWWCFICSIKHFRNRLSVNIRRQIKIEEIFLVIVISFANLMSTTCRVDGWAASIIVRLRWKFICGHFFMNSTKTPWLKFKVSFPSQLSCIVKRSSSLPL